MIIYLDVIFLENVIMNSIILYATALINRVKIKHFKIFLASAIGAIYAIFVYMNIYSNIGLKFILSLIMVYLAMESKKIKIFLKELLIFYLTSFSFGGAAFMLLYFIKPEDVIMKNGVYIGTYPIKIAIIGGLVGFIVITLAFKLVKRKISEQKKFCDVDVCFDNKEISVKALIDTGNFLKEPITGTPVIIIEKDKLKEIIPGNILINLENIVMGKFDNEVDEKYLSKFRVIPYNSLGNLNGLLLGVKVDFINIYYEEKIKVNNVIAGIYENKLSKNNIYSALVGLDILEKNNDRSGLNELVSNVKN